MGTVSDGSAQTVKKYTCNELQAQTGGPYQIVCIQENTATSDENNSLQNVFIDCVAHASFLLSRQPRPMHLIANRGESTRCIDSTKKEAMSGSEYNVEETMRHIGQTPDMKYDFAGRGYSKEHNTFPLLEHIFKHLLIIAGGKKSRV